MNQEEYYTIDKVVEITGMSKGSIECFLISGILKSTQVSPGEFRVVKSDLDLFRARLEQS